MIKCSAVFKCQKNNSYLTGQVTCCIVSHPATAPGMFTAPVRGVYYIRFTANAPTNFPMSAVLYKNGHQIELIAHEQPSGEGSDTASNGAALLLEQGDTLSLQLWHNTQIWDNSNHHSTFSGFLLFPMWGQMLITHICWMNCDLTYHITSSLTSRKPVLIRK